MPAEIAAPDQVEAWLTGISRTRSLTSYETDMLARAIDGKPLTKREAARLGIKRDMRVYERTR